MNLRAKTKTNIWVILIVLLIGLHPGVASAQEPFLVKDINPGTGVRGPHH